jgi:hypothetical protein
VPPVLAGIVNHPSWPGAGVDLNMEETDRDSDPTDPKEEP